jgi:outer membrane protein TolC
MTSAHVRPLVLTLLLTLTNAALAAAQGVAPPGGAKGPVLTMAQAVDTALAAQPELRARLYDYAAARWNVLSALSPLLPQITGTVSAVRSHSTTLFTAPGTGVTSAVSVDRQLSDTFSAQVSLSQLLFDFGQTKAATDAARKLAEVARENIEVQRLIVALTVKEAYTNVLAAHRLIQVQEQALARNELNLSVAKGFYDNGLQPQSAVSRAQVDVANARLALVQARNAERLARVALNTAMSVDLDTATELEDNLVYDSLTLDHRGLREEALAKLPEYRQSKLQADVADAQARFAARSFFPTVSATASRGAIRSSLNETWSLGLIMSWNIFDGGNLIARYQMAKANVEAAQLRVRNEELNVLQSVEQAAISVEQAQESILVAQTAIASAQETYELAQGRYEAGVGSILELTDAQLAFTQAQNAEVQALSAFRIALYQLDRAIGRSPTAAPAKGSSTPMPTRVGLTR